MLTNLFNNTQKINMKKFQKAVLTVVRCSICYEFLIVHTVWEVGFVQTSTVLQEVQYAALRERKGIFFDLKNCQLEFRSFFIGEKKPKIHIIDGLWVVFVAKHHQNLKKIQRSTFISQFLSVTVEVPFLMNF